MGFFHFKCLREEVFTHEPQSEPFKLIDLDMPSQILTLIPDFRAL
ncbi:hypothetical protein CFT9_04176 [Pseudomonas sp. CFT9]|nr:hypothetical protein CFT9_04176 [Pseudomonas sp. CFT9]EPL07953.1 hypothetical protein CF150_23113 [Pseudomonas sp. CF150]